MIKFVLGGVAVLLAAWIGVGFAIVALAGPFKPGGRLVDIGGRKLRLVCEGPASDKPVVWMEAGAWGLAADFAAIQQGLAARGVRSCAYDRAGMGFSDPGPSPRDSTAIAADLASLMKASGERGPFILMAHSMGGQHVRLFAGQHPQLVAGLVLLDGTTPEMLSNPRADAFLAGVRNVARATAAAGSIGLTRAAYYWGDRIGLPPQGSAEKRHAFVSGRHARTSADEVLAWTAGAEQAGGVSLDPNWPVAVVTAGDPKLMAEFNTYRRAPELASRSGFYVSIPEASHTSMLGLECSGPILTAVDQVIAAAGTSPSRRGG